MFQVVLTEYGQTLVSDLVNIDGVILLYNEVNVASVTTAPDPSNVTLDIEACGNLKNNIGNVCIKDTSNTEYSIRTILFYKLENNQKRIVAGYSQEDPIIRKTSSILSIYLTFDFSVFTHGFLFSLIQAGYSTAAHNTDGLLHLENPDVDSDDAYAVYSKSQVDDLFQDVTLSAGNGISIANKVIKTTGIPFGTVDDTSTSTAFTVTVPGVYKLEDGVCCLVKNGVVTSASGWTLNVNGLGAKPVYSNMAAATRETTLFNVNYTILFVYDSTRIEGGCWVYYRGYYSDANSIGYQIRGNVHTLPTTAKFYRYRLLFTSADGTHLVPSNISTSTNATALRDVVQTPIDPFGEILYYSTTAAVDAETNPGPTYLWTQYAVTLGYSFNRTGAALVLDSFKPLYIKCAPQSDGSAIIDADTPYVQELPNTADGKIYIFLGVTSSTTVVEVLNNHPIYYHDGTAIRIWHGKDSYSKSEIDTIIGNYVPTSRTVNNKALSSDITLTLDDVADGTNRSIPTVNNSTITIKKNNSDTGDSFTTNASSNKTINLGLSAVATSGSYSDLSNKPTIPTDTNDLTNGAGFITSADIPTDLSDFNNDVGYITGYTETDPTVPSWAKQSSKPSYTLDEVTDGTTRKLSNYVPTTRKVNNKALSSDVTLTLDDVSNGTNRKIPTKVSELTNDSGYITSFTETDPTVPSWAKQPTKPSYTASEVGALPDSTVIPTVYDATLTIKKNTADTGDTFTANASQNKTINLGLSTVATSGSYSDLTNQPSIPSDTSDLTNGAGFITSASIPTNVSDFTNDAGYLTTETDPTVPSWAKQSSKPSYTLDEVTDGTTRKLSNYVPTSRKINNQALTSDITLSLDNVADGSTRKIPTKVSDLTNDSGFLTTETDPTVPSWAKQSSKPTYTASEVGALPDSTVIPSNTSDLTNDAGFITSADIPSDVSAFNNDAGYLTSYTETDPTVPSWAKQSSKPSYTLDEVTDGSTRKLSNYVPTTRKVNNQALSSDITLNLDNISDGSTRKLSNYIPYNEINSTINGFDSRRLWEYEVHNTLWAADKRYDVTRTGFSSGSNATLFNGSFEDNNKVAAGGTGVILIAGKNGTKMFGGGYPYGYLEVAFYYTSVPESVTCRVYSDWAQNPGWHDVTLTNVDKNSNNALYRGYNSSFYGVTQIEITVNAKSDKEASVTEIAFYQTRGTLQQMAVFNKSIAQTLYYDLEAPKFKTTGGTSSQFVKGDGTLDSSVYITSAALPTNVSDLTNDAGYITSASLPTKVSDLTNDTGFITSSALSPYELAANLKEGAYVDVDETTMTSSSTNLPTSKAVASYITNQNFATVSQLPTNVSDLTNDAGYLTSHQSLAGVVASAQYNSTDKTIEFYNSDGTKLNTDIDASAFIKDGMVDTVSVTNGKLVITFNTDAGKSDIEIPITDIFDASNYYTKTEIDNAGYLTSSDLSGYVQKVSSTDNAITRFDGTSGAVQNSGVLIDDSNNLLIPLGSSGTFSQNSKLVIGNAWFGSNTTGGLAYGVKSGSTYTGYYTFESTAFRPVSSSDNSIDIGTSSYRWKNLYIAGKICKNATYQITIPSASGTMALVSDIPTNTNQLTNGAGFITSASLPTKTSDLTNDSGFITISSVPTKTSDLTNDSGYITISSVPTNTSDLTNDSGYITSSDIPTNVSSFTNDAGYLVSSDLSPYELSANLKEGAYVDVDETTTTASSTNLTTGKAMAAYVSSVLPTVNNATLTIQKNGSTVNTFTANASSNVTANITVPTTVAELTDASDYVTDSDLETYVQDYLEEHQNILVAGNNITITSSSSILPTGYAQVEYIQSNGASYLDTGLVPTDSTKIIVDVFNNSTGSFYVIGARASSSSTILLAQSGSSTGSVLSGTFNGSSITAKTGNTNWTRTSSGQRYLITLETNSGTGYYTVEDLTNEREFNGSTSYTALGTVSEHIMLCAFNSGNILGGTTKVYRCEIYQNDLLAFQGIPCYRNSDGRYGLYDTVSSTFISSSSSTQFTGSTEIHDVLTISSKDEKAQWGKITGTLSNQTDLNTALGLKANSADLATVATSGSYNDLTNKPTIPTVPTNVSAFNNDAGYLTSYTETDPTVPSWAKASSKPTYTLDEVNDGSTRKLSNYVPTSRKVNNKALSSDITLNLDDVADGSTRKLSNYVPTTRTVNSKALSSNIVLTLDDVADGTSRSIPTDTGDLTNNAGFITSYTETDPTVPSWAKQQNKPSYTLDEVTDGTTRKLNNSTITIKKNSSDTGDSFTTNAASAKTINLNLHTVATSGSYNDLTNKPTIPTVPTNVSAFNNDAGYLTSSDISGKQDTLTAGDGIAITSNTVRTTGIPFGTVDDTSTSTAFTVTVPGIYKLEDGVTCMVKNGVVTSASGFTIDVNGLGAKPVYSSLAAASRETTIFNKNYTLIFVYDSTRVDDGCWVCYRATDTVAATVRFNELARKPTQTARYYKLYFTSADGTKWVPASANSTNNATAARAVNQEPIDPFGTIAYSSSSTNYTTSTNVAASSLWTHYSFTLGYSFNRTGSAWSLTIGSPVYVKCAPQTNGSAIMDADTPIVQALPSTADGKIYIFLGVASTATKVEMTTNHPIYYYDGTGIRIWTGSTSADLSNYVPNTRTINSKALSSDITLTLDDVADGTNRSIPTVNNSTITIKKTSSDTGDSFTTNASSGKTINLGLATVATSGSYNDLSSKPTIPTVNDTTITIKKNSDDTGDTFTTNAASTKTINLGLHTVATSGSYNDLSNKPTIPTVNNATLTIQKNGTTVNTFTANASSNVTANITVPIESISVDGTTQTITNKNVDLHIPDDISAIETIGSFYRNNVNGSGTITLTPSLCQGQFPTISVAGTYKVRVRMYSSTASYSLTVRHGSSNTYTLTSSSGVIDDTRSLTLASGDTWSGTLTTSVGANTVIRVHIYKENITVNTVGIAAVSNDYNDLDNIPTIPTATSQLTNNSGFITSSSLSSYVPNTRTVNSKALSSDITLTLDDVADGSTRAIPTKTTARSDGKYLYNGQSVDILVDNFGISNSTNLLNTSGVTSYVAIRANSSNPFIGFKEGSNLWYCQATGNVFYFGPTSLKALKLDQNGNGRFQTGECAATQLVVQEARTSSVDGNKLLTISVDSASETATTSITTPISYTYHTSKYTSVATNYGSQTMSSGTFEDQSDILIPHSLVLLASPRHDTHKFTTSSNIEVTDSNNTTVKSTVNLNIVELGSINGVETSKITIYPQSTVTVTVDDQVTTNVSLDKSLQSGEIEYFNDNDGSGIKLGCVNYSGNAVKIYNDKDRVSILGGLDIDYGYSLLDPLTITINGSTGNKVIPSTDGILSLGEGTKRFSNVYTSYIGSSTYPTTNIYSNKLTFKTANTESGQPLPQVYGYDDTYTSISSHYHTGIAVELCNINYERNRISYTSYGSITIRGTVVGSSTVTDHIKVSSAGVAFLGTQSISWAAGGIISNDSGDITVNTTLRPTSNAATDLGSTTSPFDNVFATRFKGAPVIAYASCTAGKLSASKTLSGKVNFPSTLANGDIICIYFTNTNTAASPYISDGTNQFNLYRTHTVAVGNTISESWPDYSYILFRIYASGTDRRAVMIQSNSYPTSTASGTTNIIPSADYTYDLGSSTYTWSNIYGNVIHALGDSVNRGLRLCDGTSYESTAYCSITGYQYGSNGRMKLHHYNASNNIDYYIESLGPNTTNTSTTPATLTTVPMTTGTWSVGSLSYGEDDDAEPRCLKNIYVCGNDNSLQLEIGADSTSTTTYPIIRPVTNSRGYLGSSSYRWYRAYIDNLYVGTTAISTYSLQRLYQSSTGLFVLRINAKLTSTGANNSPQVINRGSYFSFSSQYYTITSVKILRMYNSSNYMYGVDPVAGYSGTSSVNAPSAFTSGTFYLLTQLSIGSTSDTNYIVLAVKTS